MVKNLFDRLVIFLAIVIVFYISIILLSDFNKITEKDLIIKIEYFPIIILLMGLHTIISSFRFHRLLQKINVRIPFFESLKIFVGGLSLGITPGGIGSAIKSQILKNRYHKNISSTLPVIFLERWTELLGILVVMSILTIWIEANESRIVLVIGYAFIGILYVLLSRSSTFTSLKRILNKIKFLKKFSSLIDESSDSFKILTSKKNFIEATCYSVIAKSLHLITIYLIFSSVGIDLGFLESGLVYYTSLLIGTLSLIPAGIIVTETSMIALLMKYNVEFSLAILSVILIRFFSTWMLSILGTITYYLVFREKNNEN